MRTDSTQRGDFTVFGFTQDPKGFLHKLKRQLDVVPRVVDWGNAGHFFLYTTYGDVAETETAIALKLGFVRSLTKSPLSARQLFEQRMVTPQSIDHASFRGNALVACFSKKEAQFTVFKNLMSLPQLYYWASGDEMIASDSPRCLVDLLDRVELNQDIVPFHFTFRHTPGTLTYFQNIMRLFPGQLLKWREGNLNVSRVQDLRFPDDAREFRQADSRSVSALYEELRGVVGTYIYDIERSGYGLGNLLSGGVDSSILQLIISEQLLPASTRSFSFAPTRTPSFEFEIKYAKQASKIFETEHTFVEFAPEDYPALLVEAVEVLGQPVLSDVEPCKLALVKYLAEYVDDLRFFFVGQGADALFGLDIAKKIEFLEFLAKFPGSRLALARVGRFLEPLTGKSQTLLKGAEILSRPNDPHLFVAPTNTIGVYSNLDIARRSFGDQALRRVLEYRRNLETQYLNSINYTERVHIIDLLSDAYEVQIQSGQLFLAYNKEQIYPYLDDDVIRINLAFRPETRYLKGRRTKPLLKAILEQHGLSTIARQPKGGSVFTPDLYAWMRSGPLSEMIQAIDLPGFLSKADFERLVKNPDHFLWSLLTFDIFRKKILQD